MKKNREEYLNVLKKNKIKITPQRIAVINLLVKKNGHFSAEDIYKILKDDFPYISFSTIYNTLQTFKQVGLVKELHLDNNKAIFDSRTDEHFHFFCRKCKKIYDIDPPDCFSLDNCQSFAGKNKVEGIGIYMYGICEECLRKEDGE